MKLIAKIVIDIEAKNPNNGYAARAIRSKSGKYIASMYLKKEIKEYKEIVTEYAKNAMGDKEPVSGPIMVKEYWTFGKRLRKDLPNCGKFEFDALNDIVYEDDSQIVIEERYKIYKKNQPQVRLEFYLLDKYEDWSF